MKNNDLQLNFDFFNEYLDQQRRNQGNQKTQLKDNSLIHPVSGRKRKNFAEEERKFQEAQSAWAESYQIQGKEKESQSAWNEMFQLIQNAVFNSINKKLELLLDKETIECRAMDITISMMQTILNKWEAGHKWRIEKLSSAVFNPCKAIYKEEYKFEDKLLDESYFSIVDDDGNIKGYEAGIYNPNNGTYSLIEGANNEECN